MYIRKQIRDKIKSMLETSTLVQGRVFYDYLNSIPEAKMPCIVVSTGNETITRISLGSPAINESVLEVSVVGVIIPKSTYQDTLDALALNIHTILNNDIKLGGLVRSALITNISQEIDDDRDTPIAYVTFTIQITYRTVDNNLIQTV